MDTCRMCAPKECSPAAILGPALLLAIKRSVRSGEFNVVKVTNASHVRIVTGMSTCITWQSYSVSYRGIAVQNGLITTRTDASAISLFSL